MINYKRRQTANKIKKFFFSSCFILMTLFLLFSETGYIKINELKRDNINIQKEIQLKIELIDQLEQEKDRLKEDLVYIEKIAREKFKMAKKGEKVFTIVSNKGNN